MSPSQIADHLELFRQKQERIAAAERDRTMRENEAFESDCRRCWQLMEAVVEPMIEAVRGVLAEYGHETRYEPLWRESGVPGKSDGFPAKNLVDTKEFPIFVSIERPKGSLMLRIITTPRPLEISALIGIPHRNCSTIFQAARGPITDAEGIVNAGIADFIAAAFPLG